MLGRLATLTLLAFSTTTAAAVAQTATADNPWLKRRVLHMAHQGGELESPSNTFFAYKRAVEAGADMLELDVNITADRQLVAYHDTTLDNRTNGTGPVNRATLEHLKTLDPADNDQWRAKYGGIATGVKAPPEGYTREDFQIPTLREVLDAFPKMLVNIEIKGPAPDTTEPPNWAQQSIAGDPTAVDAAVELAEVLNEYNRHSDTIVVSFSDTAIARFKADAPEAHTAAGLATTALFYGTTAQAAPGAPNPFSVAVQPPTVFNGLVEVPTKDFVDNAHANGLAVHVWIGDGEEDDASSDMEALYDKLIDNGVDGIMTDRPTRLEAQLAKRKVRWKHNNGGGNDRRAKAKRTRAKRVAKHRAARR